MNNDQEQNVGLKFWQLKELEGVDKSSRTQARFVGIVLKVPADQRTTFIVADGTATAEVTLTARQISSSFVLPKKGDSVSIIGVGYKKVLGSSKNIYSLLKIMASGIDTISPTQEFRHAIQAARGRKQRQKMRVVPQPSLIKKRPPLSQLRTFQTTAQKIDLRTLVMVHCYYFFQEHSDIGSYVVQASMIRFSNMGKQFIKGVNVTKQCLEAGINQTLEELKTAGLFEERWVNQKLMYAVKRQLFRGIQRNFQDKITQMEEKGGVTIQTLTLFVNRMLNEHFNVPFTFFDYKLSQKILMKLQSDHKIYKTSEKLIFPNIRR